MFGFFKILKASVLHVSTRGVCIIIQNISNKTLRSNVSNWSKLSCSRSSERPKSQRIFSRSGLD